MSPRWLPFRKCEIIAKSYDVINIWCIIPHSKNSLAALFTIQVLLLWGEGESPPPSTTDDRKAQCSMQPCSQGLSSSCPSLAPGGGKMRDPGNEVVWLCSMGVYKTKTEDRRPKTKNRRPESLFILQLLKLQQKKHAKNSLLDYKT